MIFLDTADVKKIIYFSNMGIIQGVTTNPTIMKKHGIKDSEEFVNMLVDEGFRDNISLEVTNNDSVESMVSQAEQLAKLSPSINVKIPIHGPNGEHFNLEVIKKLYNSGIRVNATAIMSAQQCLIAAMAGAKYVSLFGGRINDIGHSAVDEIAKASALIKRFFGYFSTVELIIGSVREPCNVVEWLNAGADIITVPPEILDKMIIHPYTKETVQMFIRDANG